MSRIQGLELLFNLEKSNFKSTADCVVAAFHCLVINKGLQSVGAGDGWPASDSETMSELLPKEWNSNQDVYSLRYVSKDRKSRILLKIAKADHMLLVNAVMNEDIVATMSFLIANYVSDNYEDYSAAYKDLESLKQLFCKEIMEILSNKLKNPAEKHQKEKVLPQTVPPARQLPPSNTSRPPPSRAPRSGVPPGRHPHRSPFPEIGGSDLDPFGSRGGGGMLMDQSGFEIPARPTFPQFGIGDRGGLPRGAVPPGATFDPFMPPFDPNRFNPDPDHFKPPDYDDIS